MGTSQLTRRRFVQWGTAAAGATALAGFTGCASQGDDELSQTGGDAAEETGTWLTGACMNNCSCGSSRCLLKVYVEDGVPLKIRTDEEDEDSIEVPQRRACPRGRAQIGNMMSPARIKYPMKRKGWSPDNPNGEMRGRDEWERISWDEALDYIAAEMQKAYDNYGPKSILAAAYSDIGDTYFDQVICLLNAKGGAMHHELGTVSLGAWPIPEIMMTGGMLAAPDSLSIQDSELHFHFGNNWMANKGGNTAYQLDYAKRQGGKVIIVEPWLNQTAQAVADEWVPIIPGTDTAFCIGMMYHMIENNLQDQDFLDKYCVGFDAEHMPEGAPVEDNFKDYVLGTYDGEPKTPEWAEAICGVPAADIRRLAEEIASTEKVNFFAGQSTTKIPAGEMFAQAFYTLALMHGSMGTPGNYASWVGLCEGMSAAPFCMAGDSSSAELNPVNPLKPVALSSVPLFAQMEDPAAWENIDYSECWQSILDGAYGRDSWPGGKHPLDIHVIYCGGYENSLNSMPNANAAIKAFRSVDFVWGANPFFDPSRQYCDIVVPVATWWEKGNIAWMNNSDTVYWADRIMEPLFESKPEGWIAEELAKRLDVDPKVVNAQTDAERTYSSLAGAVYMTDRAAMGYAPLLTISQDDIDELGVEGAPQEGLMTVAEFKEKGFFKIPRSKGDALSSVPWEAFYADPDANPLPTSTGKFEIYSAGLAATVNSLGFSTLSPIAKWQIADPEQGAGTQTDEFPLLLWTPHSLRRAHTVNDNVVSLREAFPQECFISTVDAEARGIKTGDLVLMTSPHGQVLRPAKVLPTIVPGAVALQDGAWIRIDEETGIDLGGDPNILQAPKSSGQGSQSWTGTLVQVEKYDGPLTLDPDKNTPIVMPVGIEE
ncbi:molybdopterin-dependent oxidoreductase [uncultured Adlercreutzia sp.]|uniref:molybdopterin-dependent oxidoreductase n=1 Tax=uncultured Adlercreutzia sp. TaxID=875803 RepID=UPI002675F09F|nr:molybdopterin-dependent oxidoreductase [uncultured Adlercreutzia sp.]